MCLNLSQSQLNIVQQIVNHGDANSQGPANVEISHTQSGVPYKVLETEKFHQYVARANTLSDMAFEIGIMGVLDLERTTKNCVIGIYYSTIYEGT